MTSKKEMVQKILEKLIPLDVSAKPMFGEYGLYFRGKFFGVICDDTLFIKVTGKGTKLAGRIAQESPYPGAKPAFKISSAKLNDRDWINHLVEVTADALATSKAKK
jgi:TfoX/Sxy family transcriptional regulator of competence genes